MSAGKPCDPASARPPGPAPGAERGVLKLKSRVTAPHPRAGEAMRIVARILLRAARENRLACTSSLSLHVAPPGDSPAPEKTP